jgi:hypothetical protein
MTLPPPTALIKSLLTHLSTLNSSFSYTPNVNPNDSTTTSPLNPNSNQTSAPPPPSLNDLSPHVKPLMLTLHAMFPDTLLPALDVLDRGFVVRLVLDMAAGLDGENEEHRDQRRRRDSRGDEVRVEKRGLDDSMAAEVQRNLPKARGGRSTTGLSSITTDELAASNQSHTDQSHRRPQPTSAPFAATPYPNPISTSPQPPPPSTYFIRSTTSPTHYSTSLISWSCTCPSFIFSAFKSSSLLDHASTISPATNGSTKDTSDWVFGGLGREREAPGEIPICKHLLALLLAEKVGSIFGSRVQERKVGLDEFAGWGGGWGG